MVKIDTDLYYCLWSWVQTWVALSLYSHVLMQRDTVLRKALSIIMKNKCPLLMKSWNRSHERNTGFVSNVTNLLQIYPNSIEWGRQARLSRVPKYISCFYYDNTLYTEWQQAIRKRQ